ncbi:MAG TPA: 16S rRNA (guanine(966)-N(2))-methyltransferase RsmD [Verrucomicrobiae bacterium]|jgi:16S rRNA (guanine(966)-N(2))-methyltransferase RsmD|nr:16S rRNA (guanine(966)-N(2))-methyltransferase RsmD [Verrucomicrobiae bacterium]
MRIIGGELKSRKIQFPKSRLTRPMTDRSKETVFNIMGSLVDGKHILDLYSGSGSLGLEALSRGALDVVFVDRADWATRVIEKNLEDLGLEAKARVLQIDVLRAIQKLEKEKRFFSLVFVDPPFNQGLVKKTLNRLDQSAILTPFAQVVVGHSRQEQLPESLQSLKLARTKKIGQNCLSFYFRLESQDGETKSYLSGEF